MPLWVWQKQGKLRLSKVWVVGREKVVEELDDLYLTGTVETHLQVKPAAFTTVASEAQVKVTHHLLLILLFIFDHWKARKITKNLHETIITGRLHHCLVGRLGDRLRWGNGWR